MMKVFNRKDLKKFTKQLHEQYGFSGELTGVFVLNPKKEKLYLMTEEVVLFPSEKLKVDSRGVYIGAFFNGQFRFSIEGSQLYGPLCARNVVPLSHEAMQRWMQGESLDVPEGIERGAFVLVRYEDDFLGCGKATEKELLNYIPKTRYVHALY